MRQSAINSESGNCSQPSGTGAIRRRPLLARKARHGAGGVALAREYHPNLVLMDLHMPVLDGWEATRQIKGAPETAGVCPWWKIRGQTGW